MQPQPALAQRPMRAEWMRWAAILAALVLAVAWLRWDAWHAVEQEQHDRLQAQVHAMEQNLARQLQGAHAALRGLQAQYGAPAVRAPPSLHDLQTLSDAMPGVRTLLVLDARGRCTASNRPELVGLDFSQRPYFVRTRNAGGADVLHLSPPFRSALGVYSLNLALALHDEQGGFAGLVAATLDPSYFRTVLRSGLYAADMWAAVAHGEGGLLMYEPERAFPDDTNLAQPGSLFMRHMNGSMPASVSTGPVLPTGESRVVAQHTVNPPGVVLDHPLVLALSRDPVAMYAAWRDTTWAYALFLLLLASGSAVAMLALQRRQAVQLEERARADHAQQAAEQRLETALRGADLGLWDRHLERPADGTAMVVNARWAQMLGWRLDELGNVADFWRRSLHPDDEPRVDEALRSVLAGQSPVYEALYRLRHRDGHWVWVLDRGGVTERDARGAPRRLAGTHLDMSERMHAQQALERSEQALAVTLHSIGDAVIATDPQGRITRMNAMAERLTGWTLDEALGQPLQVVFRIVLARTGEPVADPAQAVLARGEAVAMANGVQLLRRDGSGVQIADSAAPIRTLNGEVLGVVMVFSDVTAQYQARLALEDRERQLAAITNALPGPVSRVDAQGRYLFANAAYERWFGRRADEVVGRTQAEVLGPHFASIEAFVQRALSGETVRYETPVQTAAGALHALVTLVPDRDDAGHVRGHFTVVTDITERKRAEEALHATQQRTRALLDMLSAGVVVHDAATRVLDSNPAATRLLGLTPAQMIGRQAIDPTWCFLEEDGSPMPLARYPVNQVLADGQAVQDLVVGVRRPDLPQPVWALVTAYPKRGGDGAVDEVVVTFADITARMRAEEQLRLLQTAVARLNDIVLITEVGDDSTQPPRIVYANAAFERLTGYSLPEALGRSPDFLQGPQTDRAEAARIGAAVRQRQPVRGELLNVARDGRPYWVELDIVPLPQRSGRVTHMVVVQRDVTERRQADAQRQALESQLRAAQKLEAIGTLAGGIAHDFNNIVAGILGNVTLARQDLGPAHPAAGSLNQIERAGLRARSLVRQILSFSRRGAMQAVDVPLREVVLESLDLLRATAPAEVRLVAQLDAEPLWVHGDPTQLQQVLMNLCVNAWQALAEGGGVVEVGLEAAGNEARLWVRDDGCGMAPEVQARIFDPFFTTKGPGVGTGLGLAVVHGIVQSHHGHISVDSAPGAGATFVVHLPRSEAGAPVAAAVPGVAAERPGRGQCLLYVDDDEIMRLVVQRLLDRAGWHVETCASAAEALARLGGGGPPVALLISDMNMPEVSGLELCTRVHREHPGMQTIISSGHLTDALVQRALALGVQAVLAKEDLLDDLVPAVAAALEEPPTAAPAPLAGTAAEPDPG